MATKLARLKHLVEQVITDHVTQKPSYVYIEYDDPKINIKIVYAIDTTLSFVLRPFILSNQINAIVILHEQVYSPKITKLMTSPFDLSLYIEALSDPIRHTFSKHVVRRQLASFIVRRMLHDRGKR